MTQEIDGYVLLKVQGLVKMVLSYSLSQIRYVASFLKAGASLKDLDEQKNNTTYNEKYKLKFENVQIIKILIRPEGVGWGAGVALPITLISLLFSLFSLQFFTCFQKSGNIFSNTIFVIF